MHVRPFGLVVCTLLLVVGCGRTEPQGPTDPVSPDADSTSENGKEPQAPTTNVQAETTVEVLDPGAEPRSLLRYKFQTSQIEKMVMEMTIAMAIDVVGGSKPARSTPTARMIMKVDHMEVSPEGDLHYDFRLDKVKIVPGRDSDPDLVDHMREVTGAMRGLSGSGVVTARGIITDAHAKRIPGLDAQAIQFLETVKRSMDQVPTPLPEEPVGDGARWRVTMPLDASEVDITQTATYTVSGIQGEKVKLDVVIEQTAPRQEMRRPGGPGGLKLFLESLRASGVGDAEVDLTKLVPTSNSDLRIETVKSDGSRTARTTARVRINIHP